MLEQPQSDLPAIIALLPKPILYRESDNGDTLTWPEGFDVSTAFGTARVKARNCPACLLAAIRQAKIPVPLFSSDFNYTEECKAVWAKINEEDQTPWL
jgi:hypothetical protein